LHHGDSLGSEDAAREPPSFSILLSTDAGLSDNHRVPDEWRAGGESSGPLGARRRALSFSCLGLYCWQSKKLQLLSKINLGFAVLIAWNLLSLIVKAAQPASAILVE
jgi:hypothetical protein